MSSQSMEVFAFVYNILLLCVIGIFWSNVNKIIIKLINHLFHFIYILIILAEILALSGMSRGISNNVVTFKFHIFLRVLQACFNVLELS